VQLAVIGTGEPTLEAMFGAFAERFPSDVGYHSGFDNELAHLIQAGSHIFLMPSEWEPCGLNQMYSQRYGTIPVVHRTGGLADTVKPWDPGSRNGTGFLFDRHNDEGFANALSDALETFGDDEAWRQLQRNGMAEDFSWERRAGEYRDVYRRAQAN
jgi:starch synthase